MRTRSPRLLAECESASAGPQTPVHLRWVESGAALLPGGFTHVTTMCGARLETGWDLGFVTDPDQLAAIAPGIPGSTCRTCLNTLETS